MHGLNHLLRLAREPQRRNHCADLDQGHHQRRHRDDAEEQVGPAVVHRVSPPAPGVGRLAVARLFVRFPAALDGRRNRFLLPIHELAPLAGRLARTLPALARLLGEDSRVSSPDAGAISSATAAPVPRRA